MENKPQDGLIGDNVPPPEEDGTSGEKTTNRAVIGELPNDIKNALSEILIEEINKEKAKLNLSLHQYKVQWEMTNALKIQEVETENKLLKIQQAQQQLKTQHTQERDSDLEGTPRSEMEHDGNVSPRDRSKSNSSRYERSSSPLYHSSSDEDSRKKKKQTERESETLHLRSDLENLPKVGDTLPRKLIYEDMVIKGIRRISLALQYARILGTIPSFVEIGNEIDIQNDLEKTKAQGRSCSSELHGQSK